MTDSTSIHCGVCGLSDFTITAAPDRSAWLLRCDNGHEWVSGAGSLSIPIKVRIQTEDSDEPVSDAVEESHYLEYSHRHIETMRLLNSARLDLVLAKLNADEEHVPIEKEIEDIEAEINDLLLTVSDHLAEIAKPYTPILDIECVVERYDRDDDDEDDDDN